jgi:hypothetical protein
MALPSVHSEPIEIRLADWTRETLVFGAALSGLFALFCSIPCINGGWTLPLLGLVVGFAGLSILCAWKALAKRARRSVLLEPGLLTLHGEKDDIQIKTADVTSGFELTAPAGVMLQLKGGSRVHIPLPSGAEYTASQVLVGLGVDRSRRILHLALRPEIGSFLRGFVVAVTSALAFPFVAFAHLPLLVKLALAATGFAAMVWFMRTRHPFLEVGKDGLRFSLEFTRRIVDFSTLHSVRVRTRQMSHENPRLVGVGLDLALANGEVIKLPFIGESQTFLYGMAAQIQAGMNRNANAVPETYQKALARSGRSIANWRSELAAAMSSEPAATYRNAATMLPQEPLEDILEEPTANADRNQAQTARRREYYRESRPALCTSGNR